MSPIRRRILASGLLLGVGGIRGVLEEIVGEDLGDRPEAWLEWLAGLAAAK